MDLSFLATQKATPKRSGWLRYFFVAMALYPPVYVHAAETSGTTITVNTGTVNVQNDAEKFWFNKDGVSGQGFELRGGFIEAGTGNTETQGVQNNNDNNAYILFGYAYDTNYTGENTDNYNTSTLTGNVSLVKTGGATLVMATENSFTGGVEVQNGALYLGHAKAAGTGVITLNNSDDCNWDLWINSKIDREVLETDWFGNPTKYGDVTDQEFTQRDRQGAELMVNCPGSANITNSILLSGSTTGQAHISFGYATYGETAQLPCEAPRRVTLSGGVFGSGQLVLHGYSYSDKPDLNYVSTFAINKDNAPATAPGTDFTGTVVLKNAFNETPPPDRPYHYDRLLGGAVQLNLQDNVFANATIDLTRDRNTDKAVGWAGYYSIGNKCASMQMSDAQTSDNILVLDGSVELNALKAGFLGSMWWHEYVPAGDPPGTSGHGGYTATWYISGDACRQDMERWRVRVVTSGENNTLTLDDDTENAKHVFDGAIGFAQAYVQDGQTNINEFAVELDPENDPIINDEYQARPSSPLSTPPKNDASFDAGGGTLGKAGVNLVKSGQAKQYIHTAMVKDLTLKGGTLGFNHLTLTGNLNLTSNTELKLGVVGGDTTWKEISSDYSYCTTDTVTVGSGKRLHVTSQKGEDAATVTGNVTLAGNASLEFNVLSDAPVMSKDNPLLSVSGALTLQSDTALTLNFADVSFAADSADTTYYLVAAQGGIIVGGDALSDTNKPGFAGTYITLGGGYYGKLWYEVGTNTTDYLTMTVVGDPRRTWSGVVSDGKEESDGIWTTKSHSADRWKENLVFENGNVVLFGNLFNPTQDGTSSKITSVVSGTANTGKPVKVTIDETTLSADFQHVIIQGEVAPVSIVINSDYTYVDGDGNGSPATDGTNYYFSAGTEGGTIRDMEDDEAFLNQWMPTTLIKQGTGTAIIATDNSFTGGSTIEGGTLVMQHVNALGSGGIVIQNGAILQGDFADGEGATTTTIQNTITVNHKEGTVDARLKGPHNRTLVVNKLLGHTGTVLELVGSSSEITSGEEGNEVKTLGYGVFEVNDASGFYGTVQMAGYLWGKTGDEAKGGNVQLQITSGTSGSTWTNATIDLSTTNANRTVLALGTSAQLSSLKGTGANSSVVNMSEDQDITLTLLGTKADSYEGALGYGDFQTGSNVETGSNVGYYRGNGHTGGKFHVVKNGSATQTVGSAWLDSLTINDGTFAVTKDLVVNELYIEHGKHLYVGTPGDVSYGLNVGNGGILAIGASYDKDGNKIDAFAGVGAGVAARVESVGTGKDGVFADNPVGHTNFILFSDGATITAVDDWYTKSPESTVEITGSSWYDENGNPVAGPDGANHITHTFTATRDIKIADGASVTFNTRHYSPYDKHTDNSSHVMQMLGNMSGNNVHLTFNNEQIGKGAERAEEMGYVAIKDIHQFTGKSDITVEDMTVLQVTDSKAKANANQQMDVTVSGANAAIQFTNDVKEQYIEKLTLSKGGHLLVGGGVKSTNGGATALDQSTDGYGLSVTNRYNDKAATLDNLIVQRVDKSEDNTQTASTRETVTGNLDKIETLGGDADEPLIMTKAKATVQKNVAAKVHHAELHDSIVQLKQGASVDLTESVLVKFNSSIAGIDKGDGNPTATATVGASTTVELTVSDASTYTLGSVTMYHVYADQFQNVDVYGDGLHIILKDSSLISDALAEGASYIAIEITGSGSFMFEEKNGVTDFTLGGWKLSDSIGADITSMWVTSTEVSEFAGATAGNHMLYISIPEPTTATLSLLALTALAARRRRK